MRLCIIANPNSIHTQRWVHHFVECGYEVHLIGDKPPVVPPPHGAVFHDLSRKTNVRKLRYILWAQATSRIVQKLQPDVLHAHQVASAGWLGAATSFHPFMVTAWGSDLLVGARRYKSQNILARWVLKRADYVTCVSQDLAKAAAKLGTHPSGLEVAPWGVRTDIFYPGCSMACDAKSNTTPTVLSIRAMRPIYNSLDIARAIPVVLSNVAGAKFAIRTYNCDENLLAQFRLIIEEAGATNAVEYVGNLPNDWAIADLYRKAHVVVSVSSSDGTPQSILEAMACGAVPVLSDLPSLREWVQHGQQAFLVPTGDVAAIGAAVTRLLTDADTHARMRSAGLTMVRQRADSQILMHRYEEIYRMLAGCQQS